MVATGPNSKWQTFSASIAAISARSSAVEHLSPCLCWSRCPGLRHPPLRSPQRHLTRPHNPLVGGPGPATDAINIIQIHLCQITKRTAGSRRQSAFHAPLYLLAYFVTSSPTAYFFAISEIGIGA